MAPDKTPESNQHRRRRSPAVNADTSTWLWRVGSFIAAAVAGIAVTGAMVRDKFYDEMKKTVGFRDYRADSLKEYDGLRNRAAMPEMMARPAAEKYKWYYMERLNIDRSYTQKFTRDMDAFFGIAHGNIFQEVKGIWQRFRLLGSNNIFNAIIRGFIAVGATATGFMMLRENNRLWNRLDESRQQQAQDRADMKGLLMQVSENHSKLMSRPMAGSPDEERSEGLHANDNPSNDNMDEQAASRPRHKVHVDGAQHHDRMVHAGHDHAH